MGTAIRSASRFSCPACAQTDVRQEPGAPTLRLEAAPLQPKSGVLPSPRVKKNLSACVLDPAFGRHKPQTQISTADSKKVGT